jgi:hypothetical protein
LASRVGVAGLSNCIWAPKRRLWVVWYGGGDGGGGGGGGGGVCVCVMIVVVGRTQGMHAAMTQCCGGERGQDGRDSDCRCA